MPVVIQLPISFFDRQENCFASDIQVILWAGIVYLAQFNEIRVIRKFHASVLQLSVNISLNQNVPGHKVNSALVQL